MVLAIHPAALLAFDFIDSTAVYALQIEAQKTDALLPILFQSVLDYIPLSPYQEILNQAANLLRWGHYFRFFKGASISDAPRNHSAQQAMQCLTTGDSQGFSFHLA